ILVDREAAASVKKSVFLEGKDMSQKQEQEHFISGNTPALPDPLSVIVLGSGGPAAAGRASSGYLVLLDGEARFLGDARSGTFTRLGEAGGHISKIGNVFLNPLPNH